VASVTRLVGDLTTAEDAIQEAMLADRAVAQIDGPAAGLAILDALRDDPGLARWPQLHLALADLLRRLGRAGEAGEAYRSALDPPLSTAERAFVEGRLGQL